MLISVGLRKESIRYCTEKVVVLVAARFDLK